MHLRLYKNGKTARALSAQSGFFKHVTTIFQPTPYPPKTRSSKIKLIRTKVTLAGFGVKDSNNFTQGQQPDQQPLSHSGEEGPILLLYRYVNGLENLFGIDSFEIGENTICLLIQLLSAFQPL